MTLEQMREISQAQIKNNDNLSHTGASSVDISQRTG